MFSPLHFVCPLFADTEVAEDIAQDFVGGYLAGNFAKIEHTFANILREEFARYIGIQPFFHSANGLQRLFLALRSGEGW